MSVSEGGTPVGPGFFFDRRVLRRLAISRRQAYAREGPHPHAVFDGFLGEPLARALEERFPGPENPGWLRRSHREQARLGQLARSGFEGVDPAIRHFLAELSGMAFLDFLTFSGGL